MRVITLSRVKELLGLSTDDTYDSELNTAIPIVDAAVKRITRNRYNYQIVGETKNGSKYVEVYSLFDDWTRLYERKGDYQHNHDLEDYIEIGQKVTGEGIPDDTHIVEVYYNGPAVELDGDTLTVPVIELSNAATATDSAAQILLGSSIALDPVIAKACFWQASQINTSISDTAWKSKSMGPVSVTKSDMDAKLDNKSGMPAWFVKALPRYHGGH